jgi:hypothetical protein
MRGLPDQPGDKQYPREEWIDQGKPIQPTSEEERKKHEDISKEDQSGDYVVSWAFLHRGYKWR